MSDSTTHRQTACDQCGCPLDGVSTTTYRDEQGEMVAVNARCHECEASAIFDRFCHEDVITTSLLLNHTLGRYKPNGHKLARGMRTTRRDYNTDRDRSFNDRLELAALKLAVATRDFEGKVWFDAGLRTFTRKQKHSGLSGLVREWSGRRQTPAGYDTKYTGLEAAVRCLSCAGRFLITFEVTARNDAHRDHKGCSQPAVGTNVTFITEEGSDRHRMGWQGCYGTVEDVLHLASVATWNWGEGSNPFLKADTIKWDKRLRPDGEVSII